MTDGENSQGPGRTVEITLREKPVARFVYGEGQIKPFLQLNAPSNPVEELSTRDYGRFGYFFRKTLKKNETLDLRYRFLIEASESPSDKPRQSAGQISRSRQRCQSACDEFVADLARERKRSL